MTKSIFAVKIEILEQELIEFESWAADNFHLLPYIAQIMMVRGKTATEDRIEQLKNNLEETEFIKEEKS